MFFTAKNKSTKVFKEYTKRYYEGGRYRIQGSYGWAGILQGKILLIRFVKPCEIPKIVKSYVEALGVDGSPELEEVAETYRKGDWVEYKYEYGGEEGVHYLPFEEFAEHTSQI